MCFVFYKSVSGRMAFTEAGAMTPPPETRRTLVVGLRDGGQGRLALLLQGVGSPWVLGESPVS